MTKCVSCCHSLLFCMVTRTKIWLKHLHTHIFLCFEERKKCCIFSHNRSSQSVLFSFLNFESQEKLSWCFPSSTDSSLSRWQTMTWKPVINHVSPKTFSQSLTLFRETTRDENDTDDDAKRKKVMQFESKTVTKDVLTTSLTLTSKRLSCLKGFFTQETKRKRGSWITRKQSRRWSETSGRQLEEYFANR